MALVAEAMAKAAGLPDHPDIERAGAGFIEGEASPPMWFQEEVHPIFRKWRQILDSYDGERAMCGEAYVLPLSFMAKWVRHDEFNQTFNFRFLNSNWDAKTLFDNINTRFYNSSGNFNPVNVRTNLNGRMIAGFAMVAYPADYGHTGVMTFIVNHNGVVFERDLGASTPKLAPAIKAFDPGKGWNVKDYPLEYQGRLYHFGSEVDRWVFQQEPERYAGHLSIVDRFLAGD